MKKLLAAFVVLAAAIAIVVVLANRDDGTGTASLKPTLPACGTLDDPEAGAPTTLPLGLPMAAGSAVLRVEMLGKTTVAYAKITGTAQDLVAVRDQILTDLKAKGYTVPSTDQEPGFEAEAELAGTHRGTLKVTPLCKDVISIRYKILG